MGKIQQIVQLKQLIRRWRAASLRRRVGRSGGGEAEEEGSSRSVRSGFMAVYVGPERRRFVIPTRFVNLPVFASLLERAEEEYGFQAAGGLTLPCDPVFFRWILDALDRDENQFKSVDLDGFLALFGGSGGEGSGCKEVLNGHSPLLRKTSLI